MERGLLWLPLLGILVWLTWSGWNEYQKVEAYRRWAEDFDRSKYDIYAVLGQKGKQLIWGKPARSGPAELQGFSLEEVADINLLVDGSRADRRSPPSRGSAALEFSFTDGRDPTTIPFTEIPLAARWAEYLQQIK